MIDLDDFLDLLSDDGDGVVEMSLFDKGYGYIKQYY